MLRCNSFCQGSLKLCRALPRLLVLLQVCFEIKVAESAESSVLISGAFYNRNAATVPSTIEMPHSSQSWQFACRWIRQNSSENSVLAIDAPTQRSSCNCQFSSASGPAVCTPSSVQFATDSGQQQSHNVTCQEAGSTLTCSINIESGFNPRHIGLWSCKSLMDGRNDSVLLQYYKILPRDSLILASWDPMIPGFNSSTGGMGNRFECFTKERVIPPARLTFYLGSVELATSQTRYPVEWLPDNEYSLQPRMFTLNQTDATGLPPRGDLTLNQQLLATNRILRLNLHQNYSGRSLICMANQGLSEGFDRASSAFVIQLQKDGTDSDQVMAEPTLIINAGPYVRNYMTVPNTIEMRHDSIWQFACRWNRQNASQNPFLAIRAPSQLGGQINCQFSLAGRPPQCTPSSVQFATINSDQQQSSNITCTESGNSLICSMSLEGFNPLHIGLWSCRSLSDGSNDSVLLQYYDILPEESLVLASWDPIEPSNETAGTGNSTIGNRFECFTKKLVIPPPQLTFYLGGVELTAEQTRYPVEWLGRTEHSQQLAMFTLNDTNATLVPPRGDLALNQQMLASNRILRVRLRRSYNSLLLECRASQDLVVSTRAVVKSIVLHLDSNGANSVQLCSNGRRALWLCVVVAAVLGFSSA